MGDKVMLPDEMEAEKNRKIILAQADEIDILKRNVRELQEQLNTAHASIAVFNTEWGEMRDKLDAAEEHNKQLTLDKANLIQEKFNLYDDISNMIEEDTNADR